MVAKSSYETNRKRGDSRCHQRLHQSTRKERKKCLTSDFWRGRAGSGSLGFQLWGWFSHRAYTTAVQWNLVILAIRGHTRLWGKFHFCRRPFVEELAPAAFSLEGITAAPTRLIASSRPCVHIFPEPIKTLRFPDFFPTHFQTWNILLPTHVYIYVHSRPSPLVRR